MGCHPWGHDPGPDPQPWGSEWKLAGRPEILKNLDSSKINMAVEGAPFKTTILYVWPAMGFHVDLGRVE